MKHGQASAEHLKLNYQDRVAKCISEIQACEKALNKKLSELNKLLKMEGAAGCAINDDASMAHSFPQQSIVGGNSLSYPRQEVM